MSVNGSTESIDTVYQTPSSSVNGEEPVSNPELDPALPEPDIGASPELTGPVTRSGKKRKNLVPVKSSGKKKNKMMHSPPKDAVNPGTRRQSTTSVEGPPGGGSQAVGAVPQDLAALLASGLSNIQNSITGMVERLSGQIKSLESTVKNNKESIVILTDTVNKNTVNLARLEAQLRESEETLEDRVNDIVARIGPSNLDASLVRSSSQHHHGARTADQINRYWTCRRSLRLWPISGDDLHRSVLMLLSTNLELRDEEVGHITVRRVREPRSKIQDEAIVEFETSQIRDSVKSLGFKLEGKRAGIRIEVPHFLRSDLQVLQNLSFKMKEANKNMKRSLKFDDANLGLILDIQLQGEEWKRVRPDQARQASQSNPALRSGPLELSVDMIAGVVQPKGGDSSGPSTSAGTGSNATPLGSRRE